MDTILGKNNRGKTSIDKVAIYLLNIVDRDSGSSITPLKLQKILYYIQGYYLAKYDKPLFNEEFEAWAHGPCNPKIYNIYRDYGYNSIDVPDKKEIPNFDNNISDFIYHIWNIFGIYDGKYLEKLTHSEEPWINARNGYAPGERCSKVITKKSMKDFFNTEPYKNV